MTGSYKNQVFSQNIYIKTKQNKKITKNNKERKKKKKKKLQPVLSLEF